MTKSTITLELDPGYDADILQFIGGFPPDERNMAILSAIRQGMIGEIDGSSLENKLDDIQKSLSDLFHEINNVKRDIENIEITGVVAEKKKKSDAELSKQDEDVIYANLSKWE